MFASPTDYVREPLHLAAENQRVRNLVAFLSDPDQAQIALANEWGNESVGNNQLDWQISESDVTYLTKVRNVGLTRHINVADVIVF